MTLISKGEALSAKLDALHAELRKAVSDTSLSDTLFKGRYAMELLNADGRVEEKKAEATIQTLEEYEANFLNEQMIKVVSLEIRSVQQQISLLQSLVKLETGGG